MLLLCMSNDVAPMSPFVLLRLNSAAVVGQPTGRPRLTCAAA
jgi:hypothetical protein